MAESTELKVVVSMVDEMSGKLKTTQDKLASFSAGALKVGTAFTAMGGAIAIGLGSMISDAAEAEKANAQLAHSTLDIAHGSQAELDALSATSDALEKKGVLDGDNIKMGQAQLMTFGLSADLANNLSGSMADLAVNQFGVNATGDQLTQSANMVAKALNGQFGVLEKSGIRFTEAQKHMIQFGTETEKASALQEGFAQNLKFTNEVAAGTLEGKIAKLKVTIGNLSESIGGALMPILDQFMQKVQPIVQKIIDWMANNEALVGKIAMVVAGITAFMIVAGPLLILLGTLPAIIAGVTAAGSALVAIFGVIFSWVGLLIAVIAGLVIAGIYLYTHWDTVKAKAGQLWAFLSAKFEAIRLKIVEVWTAITNKISNAMGFIQNIIQTVIGVVVGIFNTFVTIAKVIFGFLVAGIILIFNAFGIDIVQRIENIKTNLGNIWNAIKDFAINVWNGLITAIQAVVSGFQSFFTNTWNAISSFFSGALNGMLDAISPFSSSISGAFSGIWDGISSTAQSAFNAVVSTIRNAVNSIIGLVNGAIGAINDLAGQANGIPGVNIPTLPTIQYLAKGGIVTKPTIAMIGEDGAEAVIPLTRRNQPAGGIGDLGGGTVTNNYNITVKASVGESIDDMVSRLSVMLKTLPS